jgi:branched-chain amino acid transport system substrate-binding protein
MWAERGSIGKAGAGILCIGAVVAAALLAGCGSSGGEGSNEKGPITVGAAVALTGIEAPYDKPPLEAMELAAKKLNAEGGIDGRKIKFIVRDMRSDTAQASSTATTVLESGAELLLVPCDPDLGAPGATVGQEREVLTFSLCEASTRFGPQSIGEFVFTPSQAVFLEGYVMAEWAKMEKKMNSAYVIRDKSFTYTIDACTGFLNRWKAIGGKLLGIDDVHNEDSSIASTITNIKAANPDFIYICSQTPGEATWIRQIRAAGLDQPILSDMAIDGTYWLKSVPELSNFYYPAAASIYGDDPNPEVNAFVKELIKAYGERPETSYSLFGPAVLELFQTAVERAGTTEGKALVDTMNKFKEVPTIVGTTTYTPEIHIALDRPMLVMQIQNGKPSYLSTWKVEKAPTLEG